MGKIQNSHGKSISCQIFPIERQNWPIGVLLLMFDACCTKQWNETIFKFCFFQEIQRNSDNQKAERDKQNPFRGTRISEKKKNWISIFLWPRLKKKINLTKVLHFGKLFFLRPLCLFLSVSRICESIFLKEQKKPKDIKPEENNLKQKLRKWVEFESSNSHETTKKTSMSEGGEEKGVSWRSLILDFCFRKQVRPFQLKSFLSFFSFKENFFLLDHQRNDFFVDFQSVRFIANNNKSKNRPRRKSWLSFFLDFNPCFLLGD